MSMQNAVHHLPWCLVYTMDNTMDLSEINLMQVRTALEHSIASKK